jgi:hypothetical protein
MDLERINYHNDVENLQDKCKKYLYHHVSLIMTDGSIVDGMIENVDPDRITMLVGEDVMGPDDDDESNEQRQYGQFGQFGHHRRPRRRFRRFRRRFFPFANLAELALIPHFAPRPYPYY